MICLKLVYHSVSQLDCCIVPIKIYKTKCYLEGIPNSQMEPCLKQPKRLQYSIPSQRFVLKKVLPIRLFMTDSWQQNSRNVHIRNHNMMATCP
jgi:hypothetical protein